MDLTNIHRAFSSNAELYTIFSVSHGTFSEVGHVLNTMSQQIEENWKKKKNLYSIQPKWNKIRNQQQEKQQEGHSLTAVKQHNW